MMLTGAMIPMSAVNLDLKKQYKLGVGSKATNNLNGFSPGKIKV